MHEDNQKGFRLRCPECRALLRIRDLDSVPETFSCADCGQLLKVHLPEEALTDQTRADRPAATGPEGASAVVLQVAAPPDAELPPAVVGKGAARSAGTRVPAVGSGATPGMEHARSPAGAAVQSARTVLQSAWRRVSLPALSARVLSRVVAALLLGGLLLLYLPGEQTVPSGGPDSETASIEELAGNRQPTGEGLEQPGVPGNPAGERQALADADRPVPGGEGEIPVLPPAFIADAAGNPPAAEEPPPQPDGRQQPGVEDPAAEAVVPPLAERDPVVAPQPELPVVPPVNVEERLAVRLRSYRTASPVAVRQLLLELEELTGVTFQLQEGNQAPDGWRERTVMIDANDVTVGELLKVVAQRAGLTVQAGESVIRVSPLQTLNNGKAADSRPENENTILP